MAESRRASYGEEARHSRRRATRRSVQPSVLPLLPPQYRAATNWPGTLGG